MTTIETPPVDTKTTEPSRRTIPFPAKLAAAALVVGAAGNTLQAVLSQVLGGRPESVAEQAALAAERTGLVTAMSLSGTLAIPFMAVGFVAAAHLLARRARGTGWVAGALLVLGMWGFLGIQVTELVQVQALLDGPQGLAAAEWMQGLDSVPLLGAVFGMPFMAGAVLGMLTLTLGLLVKGAGVPRWIPTLWLVFILLDFSIGAVGPVDPHWLYLVGAVGLAHHVTRNRGRVWKNA
jgi:hypothetical protein